MVYSESANCQIPEKSGWLKDIKFFLKEGWVGRGVHQCNSEKDKGFFGLYSYHQEACQIILLLLNLL